MQNGKMQNGKSFAILQFCYFGFDIAIFPFEKKLLQKVSPFTFFPD
jgi:hypothetical protein